MTLQRPTLPAKQTGAVLIVGLILLMLITVLAISGMNTATTELAIARNDQTFENAFQAAEYGLEQALSQPAFNTAGATPLPPLVLTKNGTAAQETVTTTIYFDGTSVVPDAAFSLGNGIAAFHYTAVATARTEIDPGNSTDRDTETSHSQSFYLIGPAPAAF